MKHWDPTGPTAPVGVVPTGCRAVPLVEVVERDGELVEVRDRRQRRKTREAVLVRDPVHPRAAVGNQDRQFALGALRRRWPTVVGRYGDGAFEVALSLVRGHVVHLACEVDSRGNLGDPLWWQPTEEAAAENAAARVRAAQVEQQRDEGRSTLAGQLESAFPEVAEALRRARSGTSIAVVTAAAEDLLAGIDHAGPRAFTQAHFNGTKAHDVRGILSTAGVPITAIEQLGLRRGDRIGLGGPFMVTTASGSVELSPLRGPVVIRLDQPEVRIATAADTVVVIENLQPAEAVCVKHPSLPVIYTAGQFGDHAGRLLQQVATAGARLVAIIDADLGGVRIARRVLEAAPAAQIVDVGAWPHPPRPRFEPDGPSMRGLSALADDPRVGWFASALVERGYPVEQELATLDIVRQVLSTVSEASRHARTVEP